MNTLPVLEIFTSIQGEGYHVGKLTTFVRLAGCNLKCPWCDTQDVMSAEPKMCTIDDIVAIVEREGAPMVTITGGEPTIFPIDLLGMLISKLHGTGKYVTMETNGTLPTPLNLDWVTCSPKPGNCYNIHSKCRFDELKYVVDDDFEVSFIKPLGIAVSIFVQPESMKKESIKRCIELVKRYPQLRLGIQLHKVLEVQ